MYKRQEEPTLAVVRDGKAVHLHPRLGLRQGGLTQIVVEGLAAGEKVITRGAYDLPDGTPVKVEEEPEAETEAAHGDDSSRRAVEKGHDLELEDGAESVKRP